MDLSDALDFRYRHRGPVREAVLTLASTTPMSLLLARVQRPADQAVLKISQGRTTATVLLTGLPVLWVTTTGARSGTARTVPLLAIPHDERLALIGTHYGTKHTPGWVYNLIANPAAKVGWKGEEVAVTARRLDEAEAAPVWEAASAIYRGYQFYRQRASHRKIEVFVLEPA